MGDARASLDQTSKHQPFDDDRQELWHGQFDRYLESIRRHPKATGTPYRRHDSRAAASVAGLGGGTGLVFFAQCLPEGTTLKAMLVFAAPAVSLVASFAWQAVQDTVPAFVQGAKIRWLRHRLHADTNDFMNNPIYSRKEKQDFLRVARSVDLFLAELDLFQFLFIVWPSTELGVQKPQSRNSAGPSEERVEKPGGGAGPSREDEIEHANSPQARVDAR